MNGWVDGEGLLLFLNFWKIFLGNLIFCWCHLEMEEDR